LVLDLYANLAKTSIEFKVEKQLRRYRYELKKLYNGGVINMDHIKIISINPNDNDNNVTIEDSFKYLVLFRNRVLLIYMLLLNVKIKIQNFDHVSNGSNGSNNNKNNNNNQQSQDHPNKKIKRNNSKKEEKKKDKNKEKERKCQGKEENDGNGSDNDNNTSNSDSESDHSHSSSSVHRRSRSKSILLLPKIEKKLPGRPRLNIQIDTVQSKKNVRSGHGMVKFANNDHVESHYLPLIIANQTQKKGPYYERLNYYVTFSMTRDSKKQSIAPIFKLNDGNNGNNGRRSSSVTSTNNIRKNKLSSTKSIDAKQNRRAFGHTYFMYDDKGRYLEPFMRKDAPINRHENAHDRYILMLALMKWLKFKRYDTASGALANINKDTQIETTTRVSSAQRTTSRFIFGNNISNGNDNLIDDRGISRHYCSQYTRLPDNKFQILGVCQENNYSSYEFYEPDDNLLDPKYPEYIYNLARKYDLEEHFINANNNKDLYLKKLNKLYLPFNSTYKISPTTIDGELVSKFSISNAKYVKVKHIILSESYATNKTSRQHVYRTQMDCNILRDHLDLFYHHMKQSLIQVKKINGHFDDTDNDNLQTISAPIPIIMKNEDYFDLKFSTVTKPIQELKKHSKQNMKEFYAEEAEKTSEDSKSYWKNLHVNEKKGKSKKLTSKYGATQKKIGFTFDWMRDYLLIHQFKSMIHHFEINDNDNNNNNDEEMKTEINNSANNNDEKIGGKGNNYLPPIDFLDIYIQFIRIFRPNMKNFINYIEVLESWKLSIHLLHRCYTQEKKQEENLSYNDLNQDEKFTLETIKCYYLEKETKHIQKNIKNKRKRK
jgi:hypothetical protein